MGRKRQHDNIPTFDEMIIPTLKALKELGGSGTIQEINEKVYQLSNLSEDALQILHDGAGYETEVDYRLAWSRTYLKKYGLIENSARAVWAMKDPNLEISKVDVQSILKKVRGISKKADEETTTSKGEIIEYPVDEAINWKEQLIDTLLKISPSAFERLTQRLLRESGFTQVEVTGKSGDGGIDGKGIIKINGFLSFHVIFQCKRYKGSVSSSQIRDFRGAMQGRADKRIIMTTGTFTRDAIKEATRDGAPPIDLIDGELLCEKLKEFNLGVKTQFIESVEVNTDWFNHI